MYILQSYISSSRILPWEDYRRCSSHRYIEWWRGNQENGLEIKSIWKLKAGNLYTCVHTTHLLWKVQQISVFCVRDSGQACLVHGTHSIWHSVRPLTITWVTTVEKLGNREEGGRIYPNMLTILPFLLSSMIVFLFHVVHNEHELFLWLERNKISKTVS